MRGSQNTELTAIIEAVSTRLSVSSSLSLVTGAGMRVILKGCGTVDIICMVNVLV